MTASESPAGPALPVLRTARCRTALALTLCLISFTAFWVAQRTAGVSMIDLMVYRAEGRTVRTGGELYAMRATEAGLPNTYPPFAALLFTPLTLLGVPGMRALATAGNLALLVALVHLSLRLAGCPARPRSPGPTALCAAAAVWCEPVWTTLRYGQVNLLLAVLVLWDMTRRDGHRWAGVGIGVAAGIKLTPAFFAVALAVAGAVGRRRRHRADPHGVPGRPPEPLLRKAAGAAAAFFATVAVAWLILPRDSARYWTATFYAAERAGRAEDTANQSLRGLTARLLHHPDPASWWALALLVALCGLGVAVAALLARRPARAVLCCAVTALLVSPVSWTHHWVWCVPLVLLIGSEAAGRGTPVRWAAAATALPFFCYVPWWVPHGGTQRLELHQNWWQLACSAVYPAVGVAYLAAAWFSLRLWRTSRNA
ncbi:glycosyltransferase 87 family protein [Streptomyces meridianus]|uniref:Glycosyltransferase 87 family protein n=1 Tax=Streptomyces meridianus TaxID=2938945 RepID=A0ABT0X0L9_9ACTN|nr:glycosyltransferase 87 family protein [Streptomyces meridianus]MCM2576044.1 glycosyltransferase 87 family protein [Streptomyces meridianus]